MDKETNGKVGKGSINAIVAEPEPSSHFEVASYN